MLHRLFIGANNETKRVDDYEMKRTLDKYFEGYTVVLAFGRWKGKNEDSRIVEIETGSDYLLPTVIEELKKVLKQEAIGHQELPSISFK